MRVAAFGLTAALGRWLFGGLRSLFCGALMILGQQALEDFFAGGGADGVADAVVFGEGFDFEEVVAEVEVGPAVGVADGEVEFAVQAAQFEDALVAGFGFRQRLLADLGDFGGGEVAGVEEVVDVGEAEPEARASGRGGVRGSARRVLQESGWRFARDLAGKGSCRNSPTASSEVVFQARRCTLRAQTS